MVIVTFSCGRGTDATLEAVNILVSESCRGGECINDSVLQLDQTEANIENQKGDLAVSRTELYLEILISLVCVHSTLQL